MQHNISLEVKLRAVITTEVRPSLCIGESPHGRWIFLTARRVRVDVRIGWRVAPPAVVARTRAISSWSACHRGTS
jgi:hypothetical protein